MILHEPLSTHFGSISSSNQPNRKWKFATVASLLITPVLFIVILSYSTADANITSHGPGTWVYDKSCHNPGTGNIELRSVSFDSAGGTWEVGYYYPTGSMTRQTLVFNEPATGGCTAYTPYASPTGPSDLYGVAAVSPTDVWVVGNYGSACASPLSIPNGGCFGQPLALHLISGSWNVVPVQHVGASENDLYAIGVDSSNNVFAVGEYTDNPVGEIWTGLIEKYNSTTQQFVDADPGVAHGCNGSYKSLTFSTWGATNYVWVAGTCYNNGYYGIVLRGDYNSSNFTDMSVPLPAGGNLLYGISADPNGQIRAVGGNQSTTSAPWHPLFERYDLTGQQGGPGWITPLVDTNQEGILYSISSVATNPNFPWITDVWAAGVSTDQNSIVYHNDGNYNNFYNPWSIVPNLPNSGNVGNINGIAAHKTYSNSSGGFSASTLWAVGSYNNSGTLDFRMLNYLPPTTPAPPKNTTSRYVETTSESRMQELGCSQRAAGESGIIVLDYGAPRNWSAATPGATPTYGTELTHGFPTVTLDKIQSLTQGFADGYAAPTCSPLTPVPGQQAIIVVGTNNDIEDETHVAVNSGHGSAWGKLVSNAQATTVAKGYAGLEQVAGGMDIEQGVGIWSDPTAVTNWYNGYDSATTSYIYNYGSCDGCSPAGGSPGGWTPQDIYNLSCCISYQAHALPEIYYYGQPTGCLSCPFPYYAPQAEQWRRISAYAVPNLPSIGFAGAMTEDYPPASNKPKDGWTQLWQALNFDPTGRTAHEVQYITQITQNN